MSDYSSQIRAIEAQNAQTIQSYFGQLNKSSSSSGLMGSTNILPSTSSSQFGSVIDGLGDYGLIQSGSYGKLVSAYYDKVENSSKEAESTTGVAKARDSAKSLKAAADELVNANYDKVTTTDSDGKTTSDYDKDSLYKLAKDFVESYNDTLDSAVGVDNEAILKRAVTMTTRTSKSSNLLADLGIKVGSDNKLSIDEDAFKAADMSTMKVLFKGNSSYASRVAADASAINNLSNNALSTSSTRAYTANGGYSGVSTSTLYDSLT
ncbi:MAG: hypothetical protein K5656_00165 [Lachnospiraceae bacterium]|nr:hypothetical protein [Lachnospiraceae bacterium]